MKGERVKGARYKEENLTERRVEISFVLKGEKKEKKREKERKLEYPCTNCILVKEDCPDYDVYNFINSSCF